MVAALAVGGALSPAQAQQRGQATPDTPRLVVVTFRGPNREAAVAASDAVRDRLMREYSMRQLWVIDKKSLANQLNASGYPVDEPLTQNDAQALARVMRANSYVDGTVTPVNGQFRIDARLVLTRNNNLVQPLPSQTVAKVNDAADEIVDAIKDVRESLDEEEECHEAASAGDDAKALAAARKGIEEYSRSTLARICMMNVLVRQKAQPDTLLAIANQIVEIDPRSRAALQVKWQAQKDLGQEEAANTTLLQWLAADPTNVQLQNAVVYELAQSRKFEQADSIITAALQENQTDPDLLRTGFLVYITTEQWQKAINAGEQLSQIVADSTLDNQFYLRMANAYVKSQQPQKAAEVISRGVARAPQSAELLIGAAGIYQEAGQLQQAMEALRRGLQINPKAPQANLALAQIYVDMNQPDSALSALRAAQAAGDSAATIASVAAAIGNKAYEAGQADTAQAREQYLRAIKFLQFADSVAPSNNYKFLLGASAFYALGAELQAAQQGESCELARAAKEHLEIVQRTIPVAGSVSPEGASQIMANVQQWAPYPDQMIKAYCGSSQ
ncbi:MAG TPA: tetratricopeptide repeat protein [Gemmatimonadaceae bacterium]|nr:tetratricopeptide repeat protein [Gemmatimonadaceae bacterium]